MTNEEIQEGLTKLVKDHVEQGKENDILRQAAKIIFKRTNKSNGKVIVPYGGNGRYVVEITIRFMERR